ncbi:interferon regulatory factor like protein [Plakobranchus ocellatus]|uniref:Interferon regulatory factor like protein n=1 Tax=Plakobranchus ocellatus TaxID=259542 RepID=A0AAV3YDJ3_9GAST|nr:interferon regulatory factor like protein [Plakobranchus ocellatus]
MAKAESSPENTHKKNLIHFLKTCLESNNIQGFRWLDRDHGIWQIPWKIHKTTKWGDPDAMVLYAWAQYKYMYDGDEPSKKELRKWKENLRNAIGANDKIKELQHCNKQDDPHPYKVYQFIRKGANDAEAIHFSPDDQHYLNHSNQMPNQAQKAFFNAERNNIPNLSVLTSTSTSQESSLLDEEIATVTSSTSSNSAFNKKNETDLEIFDKRQQPFDILKSASYTPAEELLACNFAIREMKIDDAAIQNMDTFDETNNIGADFESFTQGPPFHSLISNLEQNHNKQHNSISMYPLQINVSKRQCHQHTGLATTSGHLRSRSPIKEEKSNDNAYLLQSKYKAAQVNEMSSVRCNSSQGNKRSKILTLDPHLDVSMPTVNSGYDSDNDADSEYFMPRPVEFLNYDVAQTEKEVNAPVSCSKQEPPLDISIHYFSKPIKKNHAHDKVKICYVKNDSMRDSIKYCPSSDQFGPIDAALMELPHPDDSMYLSQREVTYVSKVLEKMKRGFSLSCVNGDIFAQRYCKAYAFFLSQGGEPVKLERDNEIKVFDFQEHFMSQFNNEQWSFLKPSVTLCFGFKPGTNFEVVTVCITHIEARKMLQERKNNELEVSLEPDCSLSNEFDIRLSIEQELRSLSA